jgi:hypothetical protein
VTHLFGLVDNSDCANLRLAMLDWERESVKGTALEEHLAAHARHEGLIRCGIPYDLSSIGVDVIGNGFHGLRGWPGISKFVSVMRPHSTHSHTRSDSNDSKNRVSNLRHGSDVPHAYVIQLTDPCVA